MTSSPSARPTCSGYSTPRTTCRRGTEEDDAEEEEEEEDNDDDDHDDGGGDQIFTITTMTMMIPTGRT
jgi:ribosomal protein L12E/L44/L45/RPP1/RPP2